MPIAAVIRPGETEFDQQERIQGTLELPLSLRGERQVSELVDAVRPLAIKQIYTSPGDPARTTARRIGEALDIPVKVIDMLSNLDHGLWEGLCVDEIKRKHPKVFRQWSETPESICPPQGETCDEAFERATKALRKPMKRKDNFAIISSEPMATLLECVLRREGPKLCSPGSRNGHQPVTLIDVGKPETVAVAE
jgi:probable phosphoglycerate mutase